MVADIIIQGANISGFTGMPGVDQAGKLDGVAGVDTTGAGVAASQAGPVPDPQAVVLSYTALMQSLNGLMPQLSNEDATVKLIEVSTLMKQIIEVSEKDRIQVDQEKKRTAIGEKTAKLDEARGKIEESRRMKESGSIWDKIKLIFLAIAAFFMLVVGAVLAAVPGLQGVGAMMITAGIMSIIMAVDTGVKLGTGLGIAGNISKLVNPDDKEAWAKADLGFGISIAVVGLMASVASFFIPGGQVAMAQSFTTLAMGVSNAVNGVLGGATAVGDIAAGANRFAATKIEAEAKKLNAEAKQFQALMAQLDDIIDLALARLMAVHEQFGAMLDALTDALKDTNNSLTRARFSA